MSGPESIATAKRAPSPLKSHFVSRRIAVPRDVGARTRKEMEIESGEKKFNPRFMKRGQKRALSKITAFAWRSSPWAEKCRELCARVRARPFRRKSRGVDVPRRYVSLSAPRVEFY